jgi:riboflavin kinase / FMN adenylyltransferase
MKQAASLSGLRNAARPIVLAAGFFDGLHRGHQAVLRCAREQARALGGDAWALTFDTHPLKILAPGSAPLLLTSTAHKVRLIEAAGMDGCILHPFTPALAALEPAAFAKLLLHCAPTLRAIVVGEDWHFGAGGKGTPALLAALGKTDNLRVCTVPPVRHAGEPVSSTRVRIAIMQGELALATAMLGRPPSVLGTVIHGRKVGRTLGFPSANLDPHNEALPPLGVYAVLALVDGEPREGVMNFGTRPTFDPSQAAPATLELHLLDFHGDLYGRDIEAFFVAHLRDEWYFSSVAELRERIVLDIRHARAALHADEASKKLKEYLYSRTPHAV